MKVSVCDGLAAPVVNARRVDACARDFWISSVVFLCLDWQLQALHLARLRLAGKAQANLSELGLCVRNSSGHS